MIKFRSRKFNCWPKEVRRHLLRLTLKESSGMREAIENDNSCDTIVAFLDEKPIAWALVDNDSHYQSAMFYVQRKYRRQGIGKKLYNKINNKVEDFVVYPHDQRSIDFFRFFGREEVNEEI